MCPHFQDTDQERGQKQSPCESLSWWIQWFSIIILQSVKPKMNKIHLHFLSEHHRELHGSPSLLTQKGDSKLGLSCWQSKRLQQKMTCFKVP